MAQLSISDVRREILRAGGDFSSDGARSNAVTGTLFHEAVAGLMGPLGWQTVLEPGELGDAQRLARHAYDRFLGPRITELQASLRESGAEVLVLFQAVTATCEWLCRLLQQAEQRGAIRYSRQKRAWTGTEKLCQPELELRWDLQEPGWTAPVRLFGVADALWKDTESGRWCVIEYKLGKPRPEADLAQACLYHSALTASGLGTDSGALAVISFGPELREHFYQGADLNGAQTKLKNLIGRLANVLPGTITPVAAAAAAPASEAHVALGKQLVSKFRDYGVSVEWKGEMIAGPSFLRYFLIPGRNARLKHIRDKAEDLGMQLNLRSEPMIHNSEGRLVVDIARPDPQVVTFSSIVAQLARPDDRGSSEVPLGVDLNGKLQMVDLASSSNPHLLVAGTSGGGKSEWLRSAVAGLLYSNTPETMRLVLIDPKRTAFAEMKGSPYLFGENGLVYPPEHDAMNVLEMLIEEMERRYQSFEREAVSDLPEYRAKTGKVIPRIVCVCDEYADLISDKTARKNISDAINRIGAKARAAGIHLIIATQNPDKKTLEGALQMNLGGRICLRVSNYHQSNMVMNESGAERLLGRGDLFFRSTSDPVRLQSPYLSAEERTRFLSGNRMRASTPG